MRYLKLKYNNKVYTNQSEIEKILISNKFYWLIDSEIENADIEIKNNTIIWNNGDFYSGDFYYGIFKYGSFYGNFMNGIWEDGHFSGKFVSGINLKEEV
jgi:hypothetical protein